MNEVVQKMLDHPFASLIVIGAIGTAVASIVGAIKGVPGTPFVSVSSGK